MLVKFYHFQSKKKNRIIIQFILLVNILPIFLNVKFPIEPLKKYIVL